MDNYWHPGLKGLKLLYFGIPTRDPSRSVFLNQGPAGPG